MNAKWYPQSATVDKPVATDEITHVRMRFIPEKGQNSNKQITSRPLFSSTIFGEEWGAKKCHAQRTGRRR